MFYKDHMGMVFPDSLLTTGELGKLPTLRVKVPFRGPAGIDGA